MASNATRAPTARPASLPPFLVPTGPTTPPSTTRTMASPQKAIATCAIRGSSAVAWAARTCRATAPRATIAPKEARRLSSTPALPATNAKLVLPSRFSATQENTKKNPAKITATPALLGFTARSVCLWWTRRYAPTGISARKAHPPFRTAPAPPEPSTTKLGHQTTLRVCNARQDTTVALVKRPSKAPGPARPGFTAPEARNPAHRSPVRWAFTAPRAALSRRPVQAAQSRLAGKAKTLLPASSAGLASTAAPTLLSAAAKTARPVLYASAVPTPPPPRTASWATSVLPGFGALPVLRCPKAAMLGHTSPRRASPRACLAPPGFTAHT